MKIVEKRLADLHHPEINVRMHSKKQIDEYCRSIRKFEQIRPLVIDENDVIICGNGLYDALVALKHETASCIVKVGMSEHDKYKLALADNRLYSLGVDDMKAFDQIIAELDGDFDIPGYDDDLLNSLIADTEDVDEMMSGYGLIDDADRERMQKASEQYKANEAVFVQTAEEVHPAATPTPAPTDSPAAAPVAAFAVEDGSTPVQAENVPQTTPDPLPRRFLVCPKCGEKIWL